MAFIRRKKNGAKSSERAGGGGLSGGIDLDFDKFTVTLFGSSRSGTGIGLIAGAGISITDSGPTAGRTYDNRNAKLSIGSIGGGVTKTGNRPVNGALTVGVGPQAGFELSKTNDFTRTKSLSGPGPTQPLYSPR